MENALIASLVINPLKFAEVHQLVSVEDLQDQKNRLIFSAIQSLYEKDEKIDLVILGEKLKGKVSRTELIEYTELEPTASFAVEYATKVKQKSLTRKINEFGNQIAKTQSPEEAEEKIIDSLKRINENKIKKERNISDILEQVLVDKSEGMVKGLPTGIKELDETTIGYKAGHYWIIGAQYKTGKTLLSIEMARRTAKTEKVFFYTLEMSDDEIVSRILKMENNDVDKVFALNNKLSIFSDKFRLSQIEAHLLGQIEPPKVVFVDYIGLIETGDKNIYERLNRVSRSLKLLAKRAQTCIIALSQLSNEAINNKTNTVGYKGSGDIAADCDVGIILTKEYERGIEHSPFVCQVILNRHGGRAEINWEFDNVNGNIIF